MILVSTCQNPNEFGICAAHHRQVGAALGTAAHADTIVAPQQLSSDNFQYSKTLAGDFNGDGKTDLAIMLASSPTLTINVGLANGDGTFALGAPQLFNGENWGTLNPIGLPQLPSQLTLISSNQDSISSALFVVNSFVQHSLYLPLVQR